MKIRLIAPRSPDPTASPLDFGFLARFLTGTEGTGCIPLALPTLAALTPAGTEVAITDENVEPIDFEERLDAVGISYLTLTAPRAYAVADDFRRRGVFTVLGGPHASLFPDEALEHADAVVTGEAEDAWPALVSDLRAGSPRRVYRCERVPDLRRLVLPRWDLVRRKRYYYFHVQAVRGCRFDCDFCLVRQLQGTGRTKPVAHVLREIDAIRGLRRTPGRDSITFADDNIVSDRPYARELFRALVPLGVNWTSQCSLSIARDEALLDLARESGCTALFIGFESVLQESLNGVNKGKVNRVDAFRELIDRIHARGINIFGSFVFGFDHDDERVFEKTLRFVDETRIAFPIFHILTPIPGTRLYDRMERAGRILHRRWEAYNGSHVCFEPRSMSAETLEQGYHWITKAAYSLDASFDRVARLWEAGALRAQERQLPVRAAISLKLLLELARGSDGRRAPAPFVLRALKEMWARRWISIGPLGLYLSLHEHAGRLPEVPAEVRAGLAAGPRHG